MREQKVTIKNRHDEKLVGIETLPDSIQEKYPAVILVPGFATEKEEYGLFDEIAHQLSSAGIASYRVDLSGIGESQGDYSETTLTKLKEDLDTILTFVKKQTIINSDRIGLLGQSFGTSISIALHPNVKSLVLMGSFWNPHGLLKAHVEYHPEAISKRTKSDGRIIKLKPEFWKDFNNYDLLKDIACFNCPILFLHGSKDIDVPLSEMEPLFAKAGPLKEKKILMGAPHNPRKHKEVYNTITSWFQKTL